MRISLRRSALCAAFIFIMPSVAAEPSGQRSLTLQDALRAGMQRHPQLNSFKLRAQSLSGEQESAKLSPPVRLSADLEDVVGSGAFQKTQSAALTLSLSSIIEPRHQWAARQSIVTTRQQALETEEQLFALDLLTDITRRFITVLAAQETLKVHQHAHQLWQHRVADVQKRVDAGRSPLAELLRAQAALVQADIERIRATSAVQVAKISLSKLWGEPEDFHFIAQGKLYDPGPPVSRIEILHLLDQHPDLRLLANEKRLRDAELRLARSGGSLNFEWHAGVRYWSEGDDIALVMGVSTPLASHARAAGQIKTATAQQQLAIQQYDSAIIELRSQLLQLQEEQQLATQRVHRLHDQVVPLLSRAVSETADAFTKGRYSYMEMSLAQNEFLDAQLDLVQAAAQVHFRRTEIDRLSGSILLNNDELQLQQGVQR